MFYKKSSQINYKLFEKAAKSLQFSGMLPPAKKYSPQLGMFSTTGKDAKQEKIIALGKRKAVNVSKGTAQVKITPPNKKKTSTTGKEKTANVRRGTTHKKITTNNKKKTPTTGKDAIPENITAIDKKMATTHRKVKNPAKGKKEQIFRYSDKDLNEFRDLINERLETARQELLFLQGQIIGKDSMGLADSSDLRLNYEDGSDALGREHMSTLISRQVLFISKLSNALIRISNKTYGVCRETGKLIDKARLRAVPHATLSIEAKNNAVSEK